MRTAVLLTCHGTIEDLDDVPAFLSNIRRGRAASSELVAEVRHRLEHIGGSPLMRITQDQADALASRLAMPVAVAARLWHPYPEPVVSKLAREGIERIVSLPMAPQSVHVYHDSVRSAVEAARAAGHPRLELREVPPWGEEPRLIDAFLDTLHEASRTLSDAERRDTVVLLTAHSLPERIIAAGDPYEAQFRAMAGRVAARLEKEHMHSQIAFQSQGASEEPWIGPSLEETFRALRNEGHERVLVAPIGFVAEHVETLYDLDVAAKALASDLGFRWFGRAPTVGTRPGIVDAMETVVRRVVS